MAAANQNTLRGEPRSKNQPAIAGAVPLPMVNPIVTKATTPPK
tara:strand:+ start:282 stop:410 length:129 start_codon:yes stop_codon:yes gene_type:complete